MYNKSRGSNSFSSRNSGRSFSRNPSQNRRPQGRGQYIDAAKFVKKASPILEQKPVIITNKFTDFKLDVRLEANIVKKGYTMPTPIQDTTIPHIMKGVDIVGIANTGTGKTGAFLIPLIEKVIKNKKEQILIVVPTRELAIQIDDELKGFVRGLGMFSVCCVGGAPIGRQISQLKYSNNFIIGTPGRIKDLIERRVLDLSGFKTVVLDEADRMLDMGFVNDMRFMMSKMPKDRQTLFFSATLSKEIEVLINQFLKTPVRVSVKTQDTAANVDQDVIKVRGMDKLAVLNDLLKKEEMKKVIIFGRTKHGVEKLSKLLAQSGHKVESIHGNKTHSHRQRALGSFKNDTVKILVATDVAARGLDISDISHVINYDIPATYDDYVHRIGRTGRGNKTGKALTFVD